MSIGTGEMVAETVRRFTSAEVWRALDAAQKPGVGVPAYTRWINRYLARYAAVAANAVGMSPNVLSLTSLLVSMGGVVLLLVLPWDAWWTGLVVAVALALGYVLDSADGQLARATNRTGLVGEWLDHTFDAVRIPAVHIGVVFASFLAGRTSVAVIGGLFAVIASAQFLSQNLGGLLRDRNSTDRPVPRRLQSWVLLPSDPGVLCWLFVLWPLGALFAACYVVLLVLNIVHALSSGLRRARDLASADRLTAYRSEPVVVTSGGES